MPLPAVTPTTRIPPQTGTALRLAAGQALRVIDPMGEQVADVIAFNADDHGEWLSSGRSIDYAGTIYMGTGSILYSNRSRPMLVIEEDMVGRHDFLLTPCSQEMFAILYQHQGHHPSCFENLATNLSGFGIEADRIPTTFNAFMNVQVGPDGRLDIGPPPSKAGDHVILRARMDLVVGVTACSAENSNNGSFKPIDIEVLDAP
ncbi:MAG: uncharacterized protein QOE92_1584 [Chloroflexota bacterium]|jgi:uncharacterized protein YcgI (DUF1989 family)|nr:uncharacterized protein [Chloroflexota bacterium]